MGGALLEVGCSNGYRLNWIQKKLRLDCYGIEPSNLAVKDGKSQGLKLTQGTAEILPYSDKKFDIVIMGFCLYLCDRNDLFKIASEVDRVLKNKSYLIILDFFSKNPRFNNYIHMDGIRSHKMDYTSIFSWNPSYTVLSKEVRDYHSLGFPYTDIEDDFVSLALISKNFVD
jgi:ubiquinone/menaquinone biosynthesis C-methylase UbiE